MLLRTRCRGDELQFAVAVRRDGVDGLRLHHSAEIRRTGARIRLCGHGAVVGDVETREIDVGHRCRTVDILLAERIVCAVGHGPRFAVNSPFRQHGNLHAPLQIEIHQRHGPRLAERLAHGGVHDLPHGLLVGEFHLGLLRMHVHVDARRVDRKVEEIGGRTILRDQFFVGFQNRLVEIGTVEITSVDEKILLRIALLGRSRTADVSFDAGDRRIGRNIQQVLLDVAADHIHDAARKRLRRQIIDGCVVVEEAETHLRVAERHTLEFDPDLRGRSRALVQKTPAGRYVVEQIAHEELRSHGADRGFLRHESAAVDLRLRSQFVALLARAQLDLRHGGDRSQRLAAETERPQVVNILRRRDLARGMTVESHAGVDGRHAAAVVHDLNQLLASVAEIDLHGSGSGVDGILHHLLHHRRGTVDDLARRNLIGDDLGQQFDLVGHRFTPRNRWALS